MRQKRCTAYEPMQTKVNRELQNPSMIHGTNKEKNFRSKRCVDHEIWGHRGQKWGMVQAGGQNGERTGPNF